MKSATNTVIAIAIGIFLIFMVLIMAREGRRMSNQNKSEEYKQGYGAGVSKTLDTLMDIMNERMRNQPPAITKLVIEDTVVYYLSKEILTK